MYLTHWPLKNLRAQVAPVLWPHDAFDKTEWNEALPGERYRYVNNLLENDLIGTTNGELANLLGGRLNQKTYPVKFDGDNLWYVLVVEFEDDVVFRVRVGMAYLDP